jgi:transcription-repair coupling factor (superfamily II helicase)
MSRDALENVVSDFIDHEFDILVATTIIETGVDIPNTNTLIVEDADKLGLSQLYQIRGRVGRSDRIAYAYLFYDKRKNLNDEAQKRLSAIKDFTALGSGYKIALRDLAIRGAGDILGSEQSGFIDAVGIELYMKLLEEAMTGETFERDTTQADDVYADRHIDENYIESDAVRIEVHKRISSLNKLSDVEDLKDELVDRFGKLDVSLIVYMYEKLFKKLSHKLGTKKVLRNQQKVTLVLKEEVSSNIDGLMLFEKCSKYKYPVKLGYLKGEISIEIDLKQSDGHWLYDMSQFIEYLISEKNN